MPIVQEVDAIDKLQYNKVAQRLKTIKAEVSSKAEKPEVKGKLKGIKIDKLA